MDCKDEWKRYLNTLKDELMWEIKDPNTKKNIWWSMVYENTIYETPKTYHSFFAFNDGSWLRFPIEYRAKNGKPRAIFLRDQKSVIKELAYFCRFQCLLGVRLREELVYHMVDFIGEVPKIYDRVFECNQKNIGILYKVADSVLNNDVKQETLDNLKDTRSFSIAPDKLEHLNNDEKIALQAKGRRMSTYIRILKNYDEQKSISQNAEACEVSKSTIKRFKKHKEEVERFIKDYERIEYYKVNAG